MASNTLKSPYPYFGGKGRVAGEIWRRLGDVTNYVEPFFGSGAVLLGRPEEHLQQPRIETVNDLNGFIANFWRALQAEPEAVARWADWPVNENDLHARHFWLVERGESMAQRLEVDPEWYDAKAAGWWVWGAAGWIGTGWCSGEGPWRIVDGQWVKKDAGQGVMRQLPHLGNAGQGVMRQLPHLGNAGQGVQRENNLLAYMQALAGRMREVRVACGDWSRIVTPSVTHGIGLTGVVLDPPYVQDGRDNRVYTHDSAEIAHTTRQWAIDNGDNPLLRIAYCGYEDGFKWPDGWTVYRWKAKGGYANNNAENQNSKRERIWFSPHCLVDLPLFAELSNGVSEREGA